MISGPVSRYDMSGVVFNALSLPKDQQYVCFDIDTGGTNASEAPLCHLPLKTIYSEGFVMIQGYPIARRPVGCHGVEVPPEAVLRTWQTMASTTCLENMTSGHHESTVSLIQEEQGFHLWHTSSLSQCRCDCVSKLPQGYRQHAPVLDLKRLLSGRHFIGQCNRIKDSRGKDLKCERKDTSLPPHSNRQT